MHVGYQRLRADDLRNRRLTDNERIGSRGAGPWAPGSAARAGCRTGPIVTVNDNRDENGKPAISIARSTVVTRFTMEIGNAAGETVSAAGHTSRSTGFGSGGMCMSGGRCGK